MTTAQLPARIISDHLPLGPHYGGRVWPLDCLACGEEWPCHTFQRNLQGQCDNRADRMRANVDIFFLRLISRPELAFIGPEVATQLFGWIDRAVAKQQALENAAFRARQATKRATHNATTGAQRVIARAAGNISSWWRNHQDSRFTNGNGRTPVRGGPPQFGDVHDNSKVGAR